MLWDQADIPAVSPQVITFAKKQLSAFLSPQVESAGQPIFFPLPLGWETQTAKNMYVTGVVLGGLSSIPGQSM